MLPAFPRAPRRRPGCALVLATLAAAPAAAADFTPDPVDLAAAKREGKVVWYTSTPVQAAQKIAKLFEAETGIRVELFRSGGSAICAASRPKSRPAASPST